jgi:Chemotaxis phosphatase CheX
VGEICNLVAGNFKNKIAGLGEVCMLSPPSVITGDDYTVHSPLKSHTLDLSLLLGRDAPGSFLPGPNSARVGRLQHDKESAIPARRLAMR